VSFEQTVLPQLDAAYNLARWLVRDPALAQDVVQDAMVRALRHFAAFRGDNPRAWLLQIVRRAAYDAMDARGRIVSLDGTELGVADSAPNPEATLTQSQNLLQLDMALTALPIELRECLVLRELEEMSYKDIARITGVPVGTVMSRLWRARRALITNGGSP